MTEIFKINNGIGPTYLKELCVAKNISHGMRNTLRLTQPKCNTTKYGLLSFRYQGANMWNRLPNDMKTMLFLKDFKLLMNDWNGFICTCANCIPCMINMM